MVDRGKTDEMDVSHVSVSYLSQDKPRSRSSLYVGVVVLLLITAVLTGLLDLLTFRLNPAGHISGNGNPALLIVFVLITIYVVMISMIGYASYQYFERKMRGGWYQAGSIIFLAVMASMVAFFAYEYYHFIFSSIRETSEPRSSIFGWGHWSQYSNTAFVNLFTYMLGIIISMIAGYISAAFVTMRRKESY